MLKVLNLGAGVQSTTLALMANDGDIDRPDVAIFADTGCEPHWVYEHLDKLRKILAYEVRIVGNGALLEQEAIARAREKKGNGSRWLSLPYYTRDNGASRVGAMRRQCTNEYKIEPIRREIRSILGLKKRQRWPTGRCVEQWFGISTDEIQRCKVAEDPVEKWKINRYPLVEMRMNRGDCLHWLESRGFEKPKKSACIICPFRTNAEWRQIKNSRHWGEAVAFDRQIRKAGGERGDTYLHRDAIPLELVDFQSPEDRGQLSFLDECEGLCGT